MRWPRGGNEVAERREYEWGGVGGGGLEKGAGGGSRSNKPRAHPRQRPPLRDVQEGGGSAPARAQLLLCQPTPCRALVLREQARDADNRLQAQPARSSAPCLGKKPLPRTYNSLQPTTNIEERNTE
eukprot:1904238-Pleurochrysis_carterae.AAC.1